MLHNRREGLARAGDQHRLPEVVGKADPAAARDLHDLGRAALGHDRLEIGKAAIVGLLQDAIGDAHDPLVQDEEVLEVGRDALPLGDAEGI
jgi:hypothetical protein